MNEATRQPTDETSATSEVLRGFAALLPPVDVAYPLWVRRKRGLSPLSQDEVQAKAENERQRAAYQAMLDQFPTMVGRVADLEYNFGVQERAVRESNNVIRQMNREKGEDETRNAMHLKVLAQLAALMTDDELTPVTHDQWGNPIAQFTNRYGIFTVSYGTQNKSMHVAPADKDLQPIEVPLDDGGLSATCVLILKGLLHLRPEAMTRRGSLILYRRGRKEERQPSRMKEYFRLMGVPEAVLDTLVFEDCAEPGCPYLRGGPNGTMTFRW